MKSNHDPRVDAYIARSAEFAQPILRHVRALVHEACPDAAETIKWSVPMYTHAGKILCFTAAFKAHFAFRFWHRGMEKFLPKPADQKQEAMGQFGRITRIADLPNRATMLRLLRRATELNESGLPARPARPKGKTKETPVPAILAAALKKNPKAAATFANFSPSHRREYITWIVEAKRDETKQKRLATALEWLAAGKKQNWRYERC